jgi:hypothetical protein
MSASVNTVLGASQPQSVPDHDDLSDNRERQTQTHDILDLRYNDKGGAELLVKWKTLLDCKIFIAIDDEVANSLPWFSPRAKGTYFGDGLLDNQAQGNLIVG